MRGTLRADARTHEVAGLLLTQHAQSKTVEPFLAITLRAAVDLLPVWALRMHGLEPSGISRHAMRAGAFGMAQALRWAFRR
jgi:uncharacterized protein (DUF2236 family)